MLNLKPQRISLWPNPLPHTSSELCKKTAQTTQVWSVSLCCRCWKELCRGALFTRGLCTAGTFKEHFQFFLIFPLRSEAWFILLQIFLALVFFRVVWCKYKENKPLFQSDFCHSCVNFTLLIFRVVCEWLHLHERMFHMTHTFLNTLELKLRLHPFLQIKAKNYDKVEKVCVHNEILFSVLVLSDCSHCNLKCYVWMMDVLTKWISLCIHLQCCIQYLQMWLCLQLFALMDKCILCLFVLI